MTELVHPRREAPTRPPTAGLVWFALMVGGWALFFAVLLTSEPTLGSLRDGVRGLPLVLEGVVWLALFPFVLALTVWESSWSEWVRFALVACCAAGWSLAFYPRRKAPTAERRP